MTNDNVLQMFPAEPKDECHEHIAARVANIIALSRKDRSAVDIASLRLKSDLLTMMDETPAQRAAERRRLVREINRLQAASAGAGEGDA